MTPRDYAWKLHEDGLKHGNETVYDFLSRVEEIIKAAIAEEREACAMIADEMKTELSQRPEKLQYGRTQIEVAEYIAQAIRARSEGQQQSKGD